MNNPVNVLLATWTVRNLLLVPHFAFPPSAIIKRKPLSATARRAGWVGCNFDLARVPAEARIWLVRSAPVPGAATRLANHDPRQSPAVQPAGVAASGDGRAPVASIATPEDVRDQFRKIKPLAAIAIAQRGWTLDVLNAVRTLGKPEFTTAEAYSFAGELEKLHPDNRHVHDKIRQQLQVLRDAGLLVHVERGVWRVP